MTFVCILQTYALKQKHLTFSNILMACTYKCTLTHVCTLTLTRMCSHICKFSFKLTHAQIYIYIRLQVCSRHKYSLGLNLTHIHAYAKYE